MGSPLVFVSMKMVAIKFANNNQFNLEHSNSIYVIRLVKANPIGCKVRLIDDTPEQTLSMQSF